MGEDTLILGTKIENTTNLNEPHANDHDKHMRDTKRKIEESPDDDVEIKGKRAKRRAKSLVFYTPTSFPLHFVLAIASLLML